MTIDPRIRRIMIGIRQACLLIAGIIEHEFGLAPKGKNRYERETGRSIESEIAND